MSLNRWTDPQTYDAAEARAAAYAERGIPRFFVRTQYQGDRLVLAVTDQMTGERADWLYGIDGTAARRFVREWMRDQEARS